MVSEEHREFPESVDLAGWAWTVALLLIQRLTLCMHDVDRVNTQISISQKYNNEQGIENLFRCGSSTPTLHAISILSVQFDTLIHKGQSRSLGPLFNPPLWLRHTLLPFAAITTTAGRQSSSSWLTNMRAAMPPSALIPFTASLPPGHREY